MKIGGAELPRAKAEIVVFPRMGEDDKPCDIIFHCAPIESYDEFDELCPRPEAPIRQYPEATGKPPEALINDPRFCKQLDEYGRRRIAWMFIQSIKATPDLEWETVDYTSPETWVKWDEELNEAGLSDLETTRLLQAVMAANCLSEDRMQEARNRFFRGRAEQRGE